MTVEYITLLISRMEKNIEPGDKACFNNGLHVIPQWRQTVTVTVD